MELEKFLTLWLCYRACMFSRHPKISMLRTATKMSDADAGKS